MTSITQIRLENLLKRIGEEHPPLVVDSRKASPGAIFVVTPAPMSRTSALDEPGSEVYIGQALAAGADTIVMESKHITYIRDANRSCNMLLCKDTRQALGLLARKQFGTDVHCPAVVGITGTNGKTTETYLMEALYRALDRKVGVIGTVSYRWPGHEEDAPLTTPGCLELHDMLARMAKAGVEIAFMEVSSHALDQDRVAGINFTAGLLTNVTQDHLDYHPDMDDYFEAKRRLFLDPAQGGAPVRDKVRVLNADDDMARTLLEEHPGAIGFGLAREPVPGSRHLAGKILSLSPEGVRLAMSFEGKNWEVSSPLVGGFNVMNLLGAQALGLGLGLDVGDFEALSTFTGVSGRLERVPSSSGLNVFVDYAHTPDALRKAISALRDAGFERIVTVFGCGGNRDRAKRPLMGQAVAELSDVAVLTSDNPRNEDPEAIMADVMPGLAGCQEVVTNPDRRAALAKGLSLIGPKDALLVAGKGHETYQLILGIKHPFSDQAILRELMQ